MIKHGTIIIRFHAPSLLRINLSKAQIRPFNKNVPFKAQHNTVDYSTGEISLSPEIIGEIFVNMKIIKNINKSYKHFWHFLEQIANIRLSWLTLRNTLTSSIDILIISWCPRVIGIIRNSWNKNEITSAINQFFVKQNQRERTSSKIDHGEDCWPNASSIREEWNDDDQIKEERREIDCTSLQINQ